MLQFLQDAVLLDCRSAVQVLVARDIIHGLTLSSLLPKANSKWNQTELQAFLVQTAHKLCGVVSSICLVKHESRIDFPACLCARCYSGVAPFTKLISGFTIPSGSSTFAATTNVDEGITGCSSEQHVYVRTHYHPFVSFCVLLIH